jgi:hypothetical protein
MEHDLHYIHLDENYFEQSILNKIGKNFDLLHAGLLSGDCPIKIIDMDSWSSDEVNQFNHNVKEIMGRSPYIIKNEPNSKQPNLRSYSWYTEEACLRSALAMETNKVVLCNHNHLYRLVNNQALSLLESLLYQVIPEVTSIKKSGSFIYPPDDGMMSWHTNESKLSPIRIYFVYSPEDHKSYFRFVGENGKVYTSWDKKGWNIRAFRCGSLKNDGFRLWHCVMSNTHRFSCGFRLTGIAMEQLRFIETEFIPEYMNIESWKAW